MTINNENAKPRIGFIGLGHMGSHMVLRLIQAGYVVIKFMEELAGLPGQKS